MSFTRPAPALCTAGGRGWREITASGLGQAGCLAARAGEIPGTPLKRVLDAPSKSSGWPRASGRAQGGLRGLVGQAPRAVLGRVDPGGLAEQNGIRVGDQVLAANGVKFEDISHSKAVEVLKGQTHIMLTIRVACEPVPPACGEARTRAAVPRPCREPCPEPGGDRGIGFQPGRAGDSMHYSRPRGAGIGFASKVPSGAFTASLSDRRRRLGASPPTRRWWPSTAGSTDVSAPWPVVRGARTLRGWQYRAHDPVGSWREGLAPALPVGRKGFPACSDWFALGGDTGRLVLLRGRSRHRPTAPCFPPPVANGQLQQLSQASETSSSVSSYSSGTAFGALNGLAAPGHVDVGISTEDGPQRSRRREREWAETAIQTDPPGAETWRTVRPPELLRDTAIRAEAAREPFLARRRRPGHGPADSPKTALLLALGRPRQPIKRSQSYLTVCGTCPPAPTPSPGPAGKEGEGCPTWPPQERWLGRGWGMSKMAAYEGVGWPRWLSNERCGQDGGWGMAKMAAHGKR